MIREERKLGVLFCALTEANLKNSLSKRRYHVSKLRFHIFTLLEVNNFFCDIIIGGDFNEILNPELDGLGGKPKLKESVKTINQIRSLFDLIDIWRVRNPDVKRFSWRQKNPVIQRRLDFWLISSSIQDDIESTDIIPAIKSDHSAITLSINGIEEQHHGPSFWKFNASLIDDENFVSLIRDKYCTWIEEGKEIDDPRVLWDYIKYKIRQETIAYSKCKARERRATLLNLEKQIQECQLACDKDPSSNQRSLRDSPILHRVCVGEMLLLKVICDALTH